MKKIHVFLLNPAAGQGKALAIKQQIEALPKELRANIEIYETKEVLHGEIVASKIAKRATAENPIRIYACGGDGTINEVLNGIIQYENIELAVIPTGTGNDFIRNFGSRELFIDIEKQMHATAEEIDVIKYRSYKDQFEYEKYCVNMFNIGFDCNVVYAASKLKKVPLISGKLAYWSGTIGTLMKMRGANIKVSFEDGSKFEEKLLLVAIANGAYCGGGFKGVPRASLNDGYMDVSLVRQCNRRKLLKLFPKYSKGTHLDSKEGKELVLYRQERKLTIEAKDEAIMFSTDGELAYASKIEFEVIPKRIKFVIPKE